MDSAGLKYISLCSTSAIYKTYCPANGKCSEDGTSCDVPPSPCPSGELICFCTQGKCYNYLNNSTTCSTIVIPDISFGGGYGDGGDSAHPVQLGQNRHQVAVEIAAVVIIAFFQHHHRQPAAGQFIGRRRAGTSSAVTASKLRAGSKSSCSVAWPVASMASRKAPDAA